MTIMNRYVKGTVAAAIAGIMVLGTVTCFAEDTSRKIGLANPVHEATAEEVLEATGLSLEAPEEATDVTFSFIDGTEDSEAIAQMNFKLDGKTFCYRAQACDLTEVTADAPEDAQIDTLLGNVADALETAKSLTGMYGEYSSFGTTLISDREGITAFNQGKDGFTYWLDAVPGVRYSLSMDKKADQETLEETAALVFVPVQGEAD